MLGILLFIVLIVASVLISPWFLLLAVAQHFNENKAVNNVRRAACVDLRS